MSGRHPRSGTREAAPCGYPGYPGGHRHHHHHHRLRPREPRPPRLSPSEPRAARGGAWRLELDSEPAPPPLRAVPTAAPPAPPGAAHSRSVLESLLLPPLPSAPRRPGPRVGEDARGGLAGEPSDSLGALLGDLLPSRFRRFLSQLRDKCTEQLEQLEPQSRVTRRTPERTVHPPRRLPTLSTSSWVEAPSTPPHPRGAPQYCPASPPCASNPFLPQQRSPSSYFQDSLKKLLLHQLSALTPLRGDHSPFTTVKKHPSSQPSRLKAALVQGSHRESLGPRRVRFADETLQDSALRYWERKYAAQQNFTGSRLPSVSSEVTEQVAESIKRWLQNLPRSLQLLAKDESRASLPRWASPDRPAPQLLERQVEDTPVSYRQPFLPKASTQRPRRNLRTLLDTLGQVDKPPYSWGQKLESLLPSLVLQSVLRRSRPKGYQLFLPSLATQRAQR